MGELVELHIGQCGVNLGCQLWSQLIGEYSVSADGCVCSGEYSPAVHFHETAAGYTPRALFIDTDPTSIEAVCAGSLGRVFPAEHFVYGPSGTNNNYASGYYTIGEEMLNSIEEAISTVAEKTDRLAGFQVSSSLCGGTGSGLLARVLEWLKDYSTIVDCYAVFPSPGRSETILEGYNSLLAMPTLWDHTVRMIVLDNQGISKAYERVASGPSTVNDLNRLVANAMCGVTASHRFPCTTRCSPRKMAMWLIPFWRLHFCCLAALPPVLADPPLSAASLVSQVFHSTLCSVDPLRGVTLSAVATGRGKVHEKDLEEQFALLGNERSQCFVPCSMEGVKSLVCGKQSPGKALDCTLIANSSAVTSVFETVRHKFKKLYQRRAFTHVYLEEGMEQMEFTEAESAVANVISEYQRLSEVKDEE